MITSREKFNSPNFYCNKYLYALSECDDSWRDRERGVAVRWEKLRHGQFANIIRTKTFGKGKEGHSFELHLLPPLSAASSMKLHYHGIARSRDVEVVPRAYEFIHACVHPLDKGRNDVSKRERKTEVMGWIQLGEMGGKGRRRNLFEFVCSCISLIELLVKKKEEEEREISNSFCFVYLL